jgi:hypothetical protein
MLQVGQTRISVANDQLDRDQRGMDRAQRREEFESTENYREKDLSLREKVHEENLKDNEVRRSIENRRLKLWESKGELDAKRESAELERTNTDIALRKRALEHEEAKQKDRVAGKAKMIELDMQLSELMQQRSDVSFLPHANELFKQHAHLEFSEDPGIAASFKALRQKATMFSQSTADYAQAEAMMKSGGLSTEHRYEPTSVAQAKTDKQVTDLQKFASENGVDLEKDGLKLPAIGAGGITDDQDAQIRRAIVEKAQEKTPFGAKTTLPVEIGRDEEGKPKYANVPASELQKMGVDPKALIKQSIEKQFGASGKQETDSGELSKWKGVETKIIDYMRNGGDDLDAADLIGGNVDESQLWGGVKANVALKYVQTRIRQEQGFTQVTKDGQVGEVANDKLAEAMKKGWKVWNPLVETK